MKAIIVHHGSNWESLCASSLIKKLHKEYKDLTLDWSTTIDNYPLFQYNSKLENIFIGLPKSFLNYDICIFLSNVNIKNINEINIESIRGYGSKDCPKDVEMYFQGNHVNKHVLQILFRAAGFSWRGDGYDLAYYPRNKSKSAKTGIAIENEELRDYVKSNLKLQLSEPWHVPLRKDLLKRIDEINRCQRIITDDLFTVHAALALRKHVEFLDTKNFRAGIEFFGHGNRIIIDHAKRIF